MLSYTSRKFTPIECRVIDLPINWLTTERFLRKYDCPQQAGFNRVTILKNGTIFLGSSGSRGGYLLEGEVLDDFLSETREGMLATARTMLEVWSQIVEKISSETNEA